MKGLFCAWLDPEGPADIYIYIYIDTPKIIYNTCIYIYTHTCDKSFVGFADEIST